MEEYIAGREFTVGILGNGGGARVFPPMESFISTVRASTTFTATLSRKIIKS